MSITQTSSQGRAFLERLEGTVLKAYRDVTGVWTIGAGLTAASGVVKPKAGMVITKDEADRLLARALARNYEPAVARMLPEADQKAFDGAVSFHFNTGAITRASWVRAWNAGNWDGARVLFLKWVKGGGKVLPGLKRRREAEYRLMREGDYGPGPAATSPGMTIATIALPLSDAEIFAMRKAFAALGYDPGETIWPVRRAAVVAFQADHGLTVDGIVGRATLTTLQRRLNARTATGTAAATGAVGGAEVATGELGDIAAIPDIVAWIVLAGAALWMVWLAWQYRDAIAARINRRAPRVAVWLRSR